MCVCGFDPKQQVPLLDGGVESGGKWSTIIHIFGQSKHDDNDENKKGNGA